MGNKNGCALDCNSATANKLRDPFPLAGGGHDFPPGVKAGVAIVDKGAQGVDLLGPNGGAISLTAGEGKQLVSAGVPQVGLSAGMTQSL